MFETEFIKRLELLSEQLIVASTALDHLNCTSSKGSNIYMYPLSNMISNTSKGIQALVTDMYERYIDMRNKDSHTKIEPLTEA